MHASSPDQIDFSFNKENLYRKESLTDRRIGYIQCLTPIHLDGSEDNTRKTIYVGQAQVVSPHGLVPLQTPLKSTTLEGAIEEFPDAMKSALEEAVERIKKEQEKKDAQNE